MVIRRADVIARVSAGRRTGRVYKYVGDDARRVVIPVQMSRPLTTVSRKGEKK
jgi:hypothetical protein